MKLLTIPALLLVAGCVYGPIPDEILHPQEDPVQRSDLVRLSAAGIPDDVILEVVAARGVLQTCEDPDLSSLSDRVREAVASAPPAALPKPPAGLVVTRSYYIPLWGVRGETIDWVVE